MQLAMVGAAEWHCIFIANLPTERSRLGKRQMMRIGGLLGTDQTRLRADEFKVFLVAVAHGLSDWGRAVATAAGRCGRRFFGAKSASNAMIARWDNLRRRLRRNTFGTRIGSEIGHQSGNLGLKG